MVPFVHVKRQVYCINVCGTRYVKKVSAKAYNKSCAGFIFLWADGVSLAAYSLRKTFTEAVMLFSDEYAVFFS